MGKRIKIFGLSSQDTAVYWYRIIQPLQFIAKQKLAYIHHLPIYGEHKQDLTTAKYNRLFELEGKWADVVFSTCALERKYLALLLAMKEKYGVKLVIDLDDDFISTVLEPNNPAYSNFLIKSGRAAELAQVCLREADMVVASTEYLKRKYETINPNIVVVKNCPLPTLMNAINIPDEITIGYAGSGSHQADWAMIEQPIRNVMSRHPEVKVKVLGPVYVSPDLKAEQQSWVEFLEYPKELTDLGMSIAVAPLKDSMLTRAKSNLRWLEYSSLKVPTIASDVVPFRGAKNIILVSEPEEWEEQLERLVTDVEARTTLGQNSYNEVKEKYDPKNWSRILYEAIDSIVIKKRKITL